MRSILMILALALTALLPGTASAQKIATKSHSTCAIMTQVIGGWPANQLYCWGSRAQCQTGGPSCSGDQPYPTPKNGMGGVSQVSKYYNGTCVIQSGALKCWGANQFGQMGKDPAVHGDSWVANTVIAVGAGFVSGGWDHVCAMVGSSVRCWGTNLYGQLGNGTFNDSHVPIVAIPSGAAGLASGGTTTCARLTNGTVKCWGLHHGNASPATEVPTPTLVSGLTNVTNIAAGDSHFCVLDSGVAKCWGRNINGQLGNNTGVDSKTPVAVANSASGVSFASGVLYLVGGTAGTCAVRTNGNLYCWGWNNYGTVGDGTLVDRWRPGIVSTIGGTTTSMVTSGDGTVCTLSDGFQDGVPEYYCWGRGDHKQLGANFDGTWPASPRTTPFAFYFWGGP